jgi:hypothetical protein
MTRRERRQLVAAIATIAALFLAAAYIGFGGL